MRTCCYFCFWRKQQSHPKIYHFTSCGSVVLCIAITIVACDVISTYRCARCCFCFCYYLLCFFPFHSLVRSFVFWSSWIHFSFVYSCKRVCAHVFVRHSEQKYEIENASIVNTRYQMLTLTHTETNVHPHTHTRAQMKEKTTTTFERITFQLQ